MRNITFAMIRKHQMQNRARGERVIYQRRALLLMHPSSVRAKEFPESIVSIVEPPTPVLPAPIEVPIIVPPVVETQQSGKRKRKESFKLQQSHSK